MHFTFANDQGWLISRLFSNCRFPALASFLFCCGSGAVLTALQHTLMTGVNMKAFVSVVVSVENNYPDNGSNDSLVELYQSRLLFSMQNFYCGLKNMVLFFSKHA